MKILTDILNLNLIELNSLVVSLESIFNLDAKENIERKEIKKISDNKEETPKNYEIILNSFVNEKKISVLKTIKTLFNLGLKETKDIMDTLPKTLKITTDKKESEEYKQKLEEAGGSIDIKIRN